MAKYSTRRFYDHSNLCWGTRNAEAVVHRAASASALPLLAKCSFFISSYPIRFRLRFRIPSSVHPYVHPISQVSKYLCKWMCPSTCQLVICDCGSICMLVTLFTQLRRSQMIEALAVSPYSSMEDYLPTQYCVGTKYKKIEISCLDKIF